jgi:hypothetical protein
LVVPVKMLTNSFFFFLNKNKMNYLHVCFLYIVIDQRFLLHNELTDCCALFSSSLTNCLLIGLVVSTFAITSRTLFNHANTEITASRSTSRHIENIPKFSAKQAIFLSFFFFFYLDSHCNDCRSCHLNDQYVCACMTQ